MMDYEISAVDAATLVKDGKARLIDVREPWEFETARIEDSLLIPMGEVPARAHQELDPDERLVVLCHHGMRSMNVRPSSHVIVRPGRLSATTRSQGMGHFEGYGLQPVHKPVKLSWGFSPRGRVFPN